MLSFNPDSIAVALKDPYPPIAATRPNSAYAQMMSNNLAAINSEMTAINQYLYQSWILKESCPQLSTLLLRISQVEMRHFNTFGQLVFLLGRLPKYQVNQNCQCAPWNANMINYTQDLRSLLHANLSAEKHAAEIYTRQAQSVQDPCVSASLARIVKDEQLHVKIFEDILCSL